MISRPLRFLTAAAAALFLAGTASVAAGATPIRIKVDATEVTRHVIHVALHIPARPGSLVLLYPKWIPGEHAPSGPISEVAGLSITAAGRPVPWTRDLVEMYEIRCEVPPGADAVDVALDFLPPVEPSAFPLPASATSRLAVLNWNQLLLYPGGTPPDSLIYTASLRLPPGWKYGTALRVAREGAGSVEFAPVPLVTLVDSPLNMGEYTRVVRLAPDVMPAHEIDIAADSREALAMDSTQVARYSQLVREAGAVFGAYHYRDYHFLLTLSDHIPGFGLEHHESSDNRMRERALLTPEMLTAHADLLPHEFAHSWNGKYRRPADLASTPYLEPQRTELLWVYEGLTMYLGWVLAARSGLLTPEEARDFLAVMAASQDFQAGRSWRPLLDTAISAHVIYRAGSGWGAWKRGVDYYDEGLLLWLEADALIRGRTNGRRSLDDFLRRFLGGETGRPEVKTYTFADVVADLNAVAPYDWASFWKGRIDRVARRAPIGGIEGNGWKMVYVDSLSMYQKALETSQKRTDLTYSLGLVLEEDGRIRDVIPDSPFARAGGAPGMRLVAVNGRRCTPEVVREALRAAVKSPAPIELLTESADYYATCKVGYHGGERYPRLVREASKADYLTPLLSPHAAAAAAGPGR
jgi:predicted metalloprotease with PDZ domain